MISFNIKMRPNPKKRWMNALRSGKYKQGNSVLMRELGGNAEYCCLGVQCVVEGVPHNTSTEDDVTAEVFDFGGDAKEYDYPSSQWFAQFLYMGETPDDEGIGIGGSNNSVSTHGDMAIMLALANALKRKFGAMNDEGHLSFPQIADWIEANL